MMKIHVLTMGRPRESFIIKGLEHYQKRLKPLLPVEWTFLPEPCKGKNLNAEQCKELEGRKFLKRIGREDVLFLLDERGRQMDSEELSREIYNLRGGGQGRLVFLVGGPYGTSAALQKRGNVIISLSKMTFTHEMALLFLSEQIYRAVMIHQGSKYHH